MAGEWGEWGAAQADAPDISPFPWPALKALVSRNLQALSWGFLHANPFK